MRKITRESKPPTLAKNYAKSKTYEVEYTERWVRKVNKYRQKKISLPTFTWYKTDREIKKILLRMTNGHCAFCDKLFDEDVIENGVEIEHFYPKMMYPNKGFEWENLYPICRVCNKKKGNKFSTELLRPDAETYQFSSYFIFNYKTGGINPNTGKTKSAIQQAATTIELYALDRSGLRRSRKTARKYRLKNKISITKDNINDYGYRDYLI